MTVAISNPGISIDYVEVTSGSFVWVGLTIAPNAAPGPANITLTTLAGTSAPVVFTINTPPPTLASMTPAVGAQGTDVPVTLTGTNFFAGATVATSNPGIAVKNVFVVSETQITATFTIAPNAALGNASVTVATSGGTSGAAAFAVNPAAPTLTSVSPATGVQGTIVPVTLTGTAFASGATVGVGNPGITVGNVTLGSATQISATFTIAANAAPGPANVTVTTSGGTSAAAMFTVNPPPPTLTSVSPASGMQGTSGAVTLIGTNFVAGATVATSNPGITVGSVTVVSATQISATFTIAANAAPGSANVTLTTSGGTSVAAVFTVNPPPPTLTSVSPANGLQGASTPVTLTGTNFISGATVATSNPGITVSSVSVVSATQITATFTIAANAATGAVDVTVTTAGGTSAPAAFTVNAVPPSVTSLWPTSGPPGTAVIVTGTHFGSSQGASTVTFNGLDAGAAGSWSDTSITVTVPSGTSTGSLMVTVGGLASNGVLFTAGTPPSITSLWPTSGPVSTAVTITGANFGTTQGASTVTFGGVSTGTAAYWSATSITVTVPSGAATGNVVVTVNGMAGNGTPYTVTNPPTLTGMTLSEAKPGDTVTLIGTGFGPTQGIGQVWLGSTYGTVVSWTDTQVIATVALNSRTGSAQVLQTGVWSNSLPFTVDTVTVTELLPSNGFPGDVVTINGWGFGNTQGTGSVQLGSTNGIVVSWSDTQILARVAASAVSGIARVQQGGISSNAKTFTVLGGGGTAMTLSPNVINMMVGETRTIQALDATGHAVTGLAWTTSDATVVSVSSADPQVLTALAPGHVTITAGSASADVTVWADAMPQGTVLWSNPGNGSGVTKIVPAVPSPSGVADVFAFQADGTVQAITSDGITAWTADAGDPWSAVPDFQGGLVVTKYDSSTDSYSITKLDGITGQPYPAYTLDQGAQLDGSLRVHTDGTIFAIQTNYPHPSVVGIDPTTGTQKFSVPLEDSTWGPSTRAYGLIIAGDGYAYVPYAYEENNGEDVYNGVFCCIATHFKLLRVDSSGVYTKLPIKDYSTSGPWGLIEGLTVNLITNADTGVVLTWEANPGAHSNIASRGAYRASATLPRDAVASDVEFGMAITMGASVSLMSGPGVPDQAESIVPVLQAQDGSFVGTVGVGPCPNCATQYNMSAFDASGNVRWNVPGYGPKIATADGGVIAQSTDPDTGEITSTVMFDKDGNATGQMDLSSFIQSWTLNTYVGNGQVQLAAIAPVPSAFSFAAFQGGNPSGSGTDVRPRSGPQEALNILTTANLTATPSCNAILTEFANVAQVPEATLIRQLQTTANGARQFVYDGPSSNAVLDPVKFPGAASPGVTTVGQWFAANDTAPSYAEGFSQFNGYAVWFRVDDWHSWVNFSQFLKFWSGDLNYYAVGTVMHEILHKQAVGGGFTHNNPPDARDLGTAISAVGWPQGMVANHNPLSEALGLMCFPSRK